MQLVLLALHLGEEAKDADEAALAAQHDFLLSLRQIAPGNVERHAKLGSKLAQLGIPGAVLGTVPRVDRAVGEGEVFVGNNEIQVEVHGVAETLAAWAGAEGIIEAEQARLWFAAGPVAALALVCAGEAKAATVSLFVTWRFFKNNFAGLAIRNLDGIDDAGTVLGAHGDAVEQNEDGQREVEIEQRLGRGELYDASLLPETVESTSTQLGESSFQCFSMRGVATGGGRFGLDCGFFCAHRGLCCECSSGYSFRRRSGSDYGKQDVEARPLPEGKDGFSRFVNRITLDQPVAMNAVDGSAARIQQAQVVVDLGRRGDGGAGVARGVFLLDGDGRSQAIDLVHIGLLNALKKLASIG